MALALHLCAPPSPGPCTPLGAAKPVQEAYQAFRPKLLRRSELGTLRPGGWPAFCASSVEVLREP